MAVKIRLMRVGKKKQPSYRVVVADARSPRDGRYIEIIGQYGPREDPSLVTIDSDRALDWLRRGAQPTDQVQRLLIVSGIWERYEAETGRRPRLRRGTAPKSGSVPEPGAPSAGDDGEEATSA